MFEGYAARRLLFSPTSQVTEALVALAQRWGVRVRTRCPVHSITTAAAATPEAAPAADGSGGGGAAGQAPEVHVTGVRLASGEHVPADVVVSNV